ncbi:MAG: YceI family protein [Bacteroidota bacterium]
MKKIEHSGTIQTATYTIDQAHSDISFSVRHLMITRIRGFFANFEGWMDSNAADFSDAFIKVVIDAGSVHTNHPQRDQHLRGDDFFAVDQYPVILFQSSTLIHLTESNYLLNGNLTIRDIREPIQLQVRFLGKSVDQEGEVKYGFELSGQISRKDFGLFWDDLTSAGNIIVDDLINLQMNIQLVRN